MTNEIETEAKSMPGQELANLPSQLRAVLKIFMADEELEGKTVPHVNFERREIDWSKIFRGDFSLSQYDAVLFAFSLWRDEIKPKTNQFDLVLNLDLPLKKAVLEALAIRWGIS